MSNFLANLVGRSLGALEVVRPRVPSIYEPHRRDSSLLSARPGHPVPDVGSETPVGIVPDAEPSPVPNNPRINPLRPQAQSPTAREAQPTEPVEPHARVHPTEGFEPPAPARPVPPSLTPRMRSRTEGIAGNQVPAIDDHLMEPAAIPVSSPASFDPALSREIARPEGTLLIGDSSAGTRMEILKEIRTYSHGNTGPGFVRPSRAPEMEAGETSNSRADYRHPAEPRGTLQSSHVDHQRSLVARTVQASVSPSPIDHQDSPVTRVVNPPLSPSLSAHQTPPITQVVNPPTAPALVARQSAPGASAVRPPLPSSTRGTRSPDPPSPSIPPKSAVQVSIGRVEVRAVFPEAPVRRAPPPRRGPRSRLMTI